MSIIPVAPFNINTFWEKTPNTLKYLLLVAAIIFYSYFLFYRSINTEQIKKLENIEESIQYSHDIINNLNIFYEEQTILNAQIIDDIDKLYFLIIELNENSISKFNYILLCEGDAKSKKELLDKIEILNYSYLKMINAYKPHNFKVEQELN